MVLLNETDYRSLFSVVAIVLVAKRLWVGLEDRKYSKNSMDVTFFLHADKEIIKHT